MAQLTFPLLLIIHVLGVTLWTGGHLILVLRFLPEALRQKDLDIVRQFEERFEPVGLAANGAQIGAIGHFETLKFTFRNFFLEIDHQLHCFQN